jgi:hypothetical protein
MNYVVMCIKTIHGKDCGLNNRRIYRPGCYITFDGTPTDDINQAAIYNDNQDNVFDFSGETDAGGCMEDYFVPTAVNLVPILRLPNALSKNGLTTI